MMLAGTISSAILMAGTMVQDLRTVFVASEVIDNDGFTLVNGEMMSNSWYLILNDYGLTSILIIFALIAFIGFAISVESALEKKKVDKR